MRPRYASDHSAEQRDCALYYIDALDPTTNYTTVRRNAYIGETGREPFIRFMENLYEQPFGDTIVGMPRVDPRVFPSKRAVWAAEEEAIKRLRPLYNYEHNLDNPERIPIPVARRQRAERDRSGGFTSPTRRHPVAGVERRSVSLRAPRWLVLPAAAAGLWILLCVLLPVGPALAVAVAVTVLGAKVR